MPFELLEIQFLQGVDQKTDARFTKHGALLEAINCRVDKSGAFNKRRGFRRVDVNADAFGNANVERVCHRAAIYEGELVVFGYDYAYSVLDQAAAIVSLKSSVIRGVVPRGIVRRQDVAGSLGGRISVPS